MGMVIGKLVHRQDFLNQWMLEGDRREQLRKEPFQQYDMEHYGMDKPTSKYYKMYHGVGLQPFLLCKQIHFSFPPTKSNIFK